MTVAQSLLAAVACMLPMVIGCGGASPPATANGFTGAATVGGVHETTFDDIKFEMEKTDAFRRTMLTPQIEGKFGSRIRIRGYIFPTLKKRGLKQFVLVRDNLECCFGPGAALFDCILVEMQPDKTAEYSIRPVAVTGKFRFEEFYDAEGVVRAIYRLDGEQVE